MEFYGIFFGRSLGDKCGRWSAVQIIQRAFSIKNDGMPFKDSIVLLICDKLKYIDELQKVIKNVCTIYCRRKGGSITVYIL